MTELGIIELRRLRREVQLTTTLVASGHQISETPDSWWRMDLETREIGWTPFLPFHPYNRIDADGIRFLCTHEASHDKWSGLYKTKRIPEQLKGRFHRLVNAIEDIRVDRLSAVEFAAFQGLNDKFRGLMWEHDRHDMDGCCLVDSVGLNAKFALEHGLPPEGADLAKEAVTRLWPRLTRLGNCRSTQEVATGLEPIFLELMDIEQAEEDREWQEQEQKQRQQQQQAGGGDQGGQGDPQESEDTDGAGDGANGAQNGDPSAGAESGDSAGSGAKGDEAEKGEGRGGSAAGSGDAPPDPLAGLDNLPATGGADEPTDTPAKSEGDKGTEPLAVGEELAGMAKDAKDQHTRDNLERQARNRMTKEQEGRAAAATQLGKKAAPSSTGQAYWDEKAAVMRGPINVLTQRLKTVLRHNAMTHPMTSQRRGRFDPGRAFRLQTGNVKVFMQPGTVGGLTYTFGLLSDVSSSMNDNREIGPAFEAVVLIAEALNNAGLDQFIIPWGSVVHHSKPIHEPLAAHRGPLGSILCRGRGGTHESLALSLAIDEFDKVKDGKKLLICVTDGDTTAKNESAQMIRELEADDVRCVTIRIGGQPASHYKNGRSVTHATELTKVLPELVNEIVTRAA